MYIGCLCKLQVTTHFLYSVCANSRPPLYLLACANSRLVSTYLYLSYLFPSPITIIRQLPALSPQHQVNTRPDPLQHHKLVKDFDFEQGQVVLYRNRRVEKEANQKSKPRYLGLMVVIRQTKGGLYILAKLDGTVSAMRFAAFQIIPYFPCTKISLSSMDFGSSSDTIDKM